MNTLMKTAAALAVSITFLFSQVVVSHADYNRVSESVNLRENPSTDARVLKLVPMGYEVEVLNTGDGWTKASFEGVTGYIKSEFIELIKGDPPAAAANTSAPAATTTAAPAETRTPPPGAEPAEPAALRYGSEGDAVRELQKILTEKGVYAGPINGKYGPMTEEAVMLYQQNMGLEMDGVVGAETLKKLTEKPRAPGTFRRDDEGDEVKAVQKALKDKRFYTGPLNGKFGPLTEAAVLKFQKANGLEEDGVVGRATLELLNSSKAASAPETKKSGTSKPSAGEVELIEWSNARSIIKVGLNAQIYDVRSGTIYYVRSFSNGRHADVEPVSVEDTEKMLKTYGGTWSWSPRPVWVTVNGRTMAASINGMPHGGGVISSNGMNGQVCLHFKGSYTHNNNASFAQQHQDAIDEAWAAAKK